MNNILNKKFKILALLILAVVMSAATFGFAAANVVEDSVAGEGFGDISGYDVTGIVYSLDSNDPGDFDSVQFTLNANASEAYVGFGDGSTVEWSTTTCGGGPTNWTCLITGVSFRVIDVLELHVSAVQ